MLEIFWKTYTFTTVISKIKHVKLVEKKKFSDTTLKQEKNTYIVKIASFLSFDIYVYIFQ